MRPLLLLTLAPALLRPFPSNADMIYEFIKMDCDKQTKSANIKVFHDWNKSGQERVERHEKNTYYFDELAEQHKPIQCSLGEGQTVSLVVGKSDKHPANNNYRVTLNNYGLRGWFPIYPASDLHIQSVKPDVFKVRICRASLAHANRIDPKQCELQHIGRSEKEPE